MCVCGEALSKSVILIHRFVFCQTLSVEREKSSNDFEIASNPWSNRLEEIKQRDVVSLMNEIQFHLLKYRKCTGGFSSFLIRFDFFDCRASQKSKLKLYEHQTVDLDKNNFIKSIAGDSVSEMDDDATEAGESIDQTYDGSDSHMFDNR